MKEANVTYQAGDSRSNPGVSVDYMLAEIGDIELYAEAVNPTWDDETESYVDEAATYDELKAAILEQAEQNGIDAGRLSFCYDDDDEGNDEKPSYMWSVWTGEFDNDTAEWYDNYNEAFDAWHVLGEELSEGNSAYMIRCNKDGEPVEDHEHELVREDGAIREYYNGEHMWL